MAWFVGNNDNNSTAAKPIKEALNKIKSGSIDIIPEEPAPMTIWRIPI